MPARKPRTPSYRLHKATGQAVVTLNGHDHYLGEHGTPASREKYDRLIAEWLSAGRQPVTTSAKAGSATGIAVKELAARFWLHAQQHYRRDDGTPTSEATIYRQVLKPLVKLYGSAPAIDFGPIALRAVRDQMIQQGWDRDSINRQVSRLRHVFKWAVGHELVPETTWRALQSVEPLRRGRSAAKEGRKVLPAPQAAIDALRPHVSRQVWALIQLQLRTGARPGELVKLRPVDIDMSEDVWEAKLSEHKNAHHGKDRFIRFGPEAQAILRPFLDRLVDAYLFSAEEATEEHREKRTAKRSTPRSCGNGVGTNRVDAPRLRPRRHYDVASYRRAIARACEAAFPCPAAEDLERIAKRLKKEQGLHLSDTRKQAAKEHPELVDAAKAWREANHIHPNQFRHNAATELRKHFGIEAAQVVLGHSSLSTTEIYAEVDREKALDVARRVG